MEVKDITERLESAADVATGAVVDAADTFAHPGSEASRLERKGAPVRQRAHRELAGAVGDAHEAVADLAEAMLPERVVLRGLSLVRARARRVDLIGELTYRGLDVFHGSVKEIARAFDRIEKASTPPARPKRSVSRAARTSAAQTRTAAKQTAGSARRRARTTARRSARRAPAARRSA
jgi:methyl-accepting chemotaxis protein